MMEDTLGTALDCQGLLQDRLEGQGHLRELCSAHSGPAFSYFLCICVPSVQ